MNRTAACLALCLVAAVSAARADVSLPHVFGSHMVLQRDTKIPVWGWAAPGEPVKVSLGSGPAVPALANAAGEWRVTLPPMPAGGPHKLTVAGRTTVVLEDVLVGEVWLCSGQSNMEWTLGGADRAQEEIAAAEWPQIRHLGIPKVTSAVPEKDVNAEWRVCSPATAAGFTAVGYFFGRELHRTLKVPVGLINSSWGGTRIEPWTPPAGFGAADTLADIRTRVALADPRTDAHRARLRDYLATNAAWTARAQAALASGAVLEPLPPYPPELAPLRGHQDPCALYNAMIHPLVPYAIRGAIWYQGESNHGEGKLYTDKTRALVEGWRGAWNQGPLPFYYVQIAPFQYGEEDPFILPEFWEAQAAAQAIPDTGMAVIHDVGNIRDIHPRNKQEVGRRLALLALAKTYGAKDTVFSGPVFQSMSPEGAKLRVTFDHAHGGLVTRDGKAPSHFEIIGEGTDFVPAEAAIDGSSVVLSSPACTNPVAVRFGWHKTAEPNLANGAGLPAAPFRAGEAPTLDWLAIKVAESKDYRLVYSLDLAKLGRTIAYDEDHAAEIGGAFDRVAYFLELQKAGGTPQYVYASMDAFTADPRKVGVPTAASGARVQAPVTNLTVLSNVPGLKTGEALAGGNLEFWPHNYGAPNGASVPGASGDVYDWGDAPVDPVDGYGSMQVHNGAAKQTVFAINNWKAAAGADIGIGNSTGKTLDWTFTGNAQTYTVKRLRVLVRPAR